jgi:hypothetical protein
MSGPILLSFLPVFTTVASWVTFLSISQACCPSPLGLLHHISCRMLTVWLTNVWLHVLSQLECPLLVLIVPQTLAFLSCSVSANITLLQKCDGSGLSFCLKLIELCSPTSAPWLLVHTDTNYTFIFYFIPHVSVIHIDHHQIKKCRCGRKSVQKRPLLIVKITKYE